jgi:hypothetical protein
LCALAFLALSFCYSTSFHFTICDGTDVLPPRFEKP